MINFRMTAFENEILVMKPGRYEMQSYDELKVKTETIQRLRVEAKKAENV